MLVIDCLNELFNREWFNKYDLCMNMIKQGIFDRILLVFGSIEEQTEKPYNLLLPKVIDLLKCISSVNSVRIKKAICCGNIMSALISHLNKVQHLNSPNVLHIVKILK